MKTSKLSNQKAEKALLTFSGLTALGHIPFEAAWPRVKAMLMIKTQRQLAEFLNISEKTVSVAKSRGVFPIRWAHKIAQKSNISIGYIIDGYPGHPPQKRQDDELRHVRSLMIDVLHKAEIALDATVLVSCHDDIIEMLIEYYKDTFEVHCFEHAKKLLKGQCK